jgi:cysteine sulfinate desulfinase/cysteine desulfurase-like protein
MAMGYSYEDSRSSLRFSFSPFTTSTDAAQYVAKIQTILKTIL